LPNRVRFPAKPRDLPNRATPDYLKSVRNETSVKSGCFFFLLPFSFFLPDEQVFFSRSKKKEKGRRKKEKCSTELRTVFDYFCLPTTSVASPPSPS
jgi:hypothetical protein